MRPRKYDHEQILKLFNDQKTVIEIAKSIGCGLDLVYTVIAKAVGKRKPGKPSRFEQPVLKLFHEQGLTVTKIAEHIGCNRVTAYKILLKHGCIREQSEYLTEEGKELSFKIDVTDYLGVCDLADKHNVSLVSIFRRYIKEGLQRDAISRAA